MYPNQNLAEDFAEQHDLADEHPDGETLRWCCANGVQVSSRVGVDEYQSSSWPRRTRSKEGNLAYFYDTVGYDAYDFVGQLDADHAEVGLVTVVGALKSQ